MASINNPSNNQPNKPSKNAEAPKIFSTDGIRGEANQFPITSEIILKVGQALGYILKQKPSARGGQQHTVLIGKDTRISGYMVEQALSSGLNSMGIKVQLTGPLPTPGIGFLARNMRADAGIVISASHNSFKDNGVKIFGADGFKIPDTMEREIEGLVFGNDLEEFLVAPHKIGRTRRIDDAVGRYVVYAKSTFPLDMNLEGFRIVLDCANGAAYKSAPWIFEELGAEVILIGDKPNGFNINDKVGALHPQKTSEAVTQYRADLGITLDGDADRLIMVDENGDVVDGDHILCFSAIHQKEQGQLKSNTIVATEMSNIGLDLTLEKHGIKVIRTDVGDKNVVKEMIKGGHSLGGEQSGHIICLDHSTTGDGCVAALNVLAVMKKQNKKLSELKSLMSTYPQTLVNTKIKEKKPLNEIAGYNDLLKKVEKDLGGDSRVFVRYSGTEPLVRVLVEGNDSVKVDKAAHEVTAFLKDNLI